MDNGVNGQESVLCDAAGIRRTSWTQNCFNIGFRIMGATNRLVFTATEGPHKSHTMVANRRVGQFAGHKLATIILRCYTCFKTTGDDKVQVEQTELRRERF